MASDDRDRVADELDRLAQEQRPGPEESAIIFGRSQEVIPPEVPPVGLGSWEGPCEEEAPLTEADLAAALPVLTGPPPPSPQEQELADAHKMLAAVGAPEGLLPDRLALWGKRWLVQNAAQTDSKGDARHTESCACQRCTDGRTLMRVRAFQKHT